MSREQHAGFPEALTLRELKVKGRVLVTTLLDHRQFSKPELSTLHARRWQVELDLRNLKTAMGMDILKCRTPEMNQKQVWVHLLAYNVIRLMMAQAARHAGVDPRHLSFKHAMQLWIEWDARGLSSMHDGERLLQLMTQCPVGRRSGRLEPRVRKRRPKPYPCLNVPRASARRHIQIHGHYQRIK